MGLLIDPFATIARLQGRVSAVITNPGQAAYNPHTTGTPPADLVITVKGSFQQGGPQGFQVDGEKGLATSYSGIFLSTTEEIQDGLDNASLSDFAFTPNVTVIAVEGVDYQISQIRKRYFEGVETGKEFLLSR